MELCYRVFRLANSFFRKFLVNTLDYFVSFTLYYCIIYYR